MKAVCPTDLKHEDFRMKGARAQSLPDVLCDGAAVAEEGDGGDVGRSVVVRWL